MQPILLDTSIYVAALRRENAAAALDRLTADTVLWLSAVVLEELHAGAREHDRGVLEQWQQDFNGAGRILVPTLSDWIQAGEILSRLALKYDYEIIGRSRLTNDALIAASASRLGIRVITANAKDFRMLAEFHAFAWQTAVL